MKSIFTTLSAALVLGLGIPAQAAVTGQWDFNNSNLVATVGTDLAYMGDTESLTVFTNMTIGGQTATVMRFPACSSTEGYTMTHGMAPNGGGSGSYVNQWTLIMDLMITSDTTNHYHALLQSNMGNGNDADLWINKANRIGAGTYHGYVSPDVFHRIAFVVDASSSTAANNSIRKFIDGVFVGANTGISQDGTYGLDPQALLFTDNDGETTYGFVNSIQICDTNLTDSDIFALGAATAAGIPTNIPTLTSVVVTVTPTNQSNVVGMTGNHFTAAAVGSGTLTYKWYRNNTALPDQTNAVLRLTNVQLTNGGNYTVVVANGLQSVTSSPPCVLTVNPAPLTYVAGQWDFNSNDLRATVGQDLEYFDTTVQNDTSFNTTTTLGISDINGEAASVMFCNPSTIGSANWGGFLMRHGMAANGGGTKVNQYTLIFDVYYPSLSSGFYRGLWQTTAANTNDADIFINGSNRIGVSSQYDGELGLDGWHRIVLAFDLTKRELGKYIDGTNVLTTAVGSSPYGPNDAQYLSSTTDPETGGGVDMRWSLDSAALFLADGGDDGEVQPVYVSSVQIRSGRMTDVAIAALGAPTAGKIPGAIKASSSGKSIVIVWTGTVLETATSVNGPWTEVTGAAHPYEIAAPSGNQFFRVRQ